VANHRFQLRNNRTIKFLALIKKRFLKWIWEGLPQAQTPLFPTYMTLLKMIKIQLFRWAIKKTLLATKTVLITRITKIVLILDNYHFLVIIHLLELQIVKTQFCHIKRQDKLQKFPIRYWMRPSSEMITTLTWWIGVIPII
jgi:hypothetical protein